METSAVRSVSLSMNSVRFFDRPSSPCNQRDTFDAEATASLVAGMLVAANCTVPYLPRMNSSSTICRQGVSQNISKFTSCQQIRIYIKLIKSASKKYTEFTRCQIHNKTKIKCTNSLLLKF